MQNQYGDNAVDLVSNSVDTNQFHAPERAKQSVPTVGLLYSTEHCKGLEVSLEVLRLLRKRWPDLRVVSFGSEHPRDQLLLGAASTLSYLPPQHEIRNLYASCDLWLTASRSEGFNLPAMEAMACRTPVVSTDTGWPLEAIKSGWNGVLVNVGDVAGLARGAEWILSQSDESWRTLSANAYATATAGSWRESARRFEAALKHACERAARDEILGKCLGEGGFVSGTGIIQNELRHIDPRDP